MNLIIPGERHTQYSFLLLIPFWRFLFFPSFARELARDGALQGCPEKRRKQLASMPEKSKKADTISACR